MDDELCMVYRATQHDFEFQNRYPSPTIGLVEQFMEDVGHRSSFTCDDHTAR
jgi:hypothetical protein